MNVSQIFAEVRDRALSDNIDRPDAALYRILNSRVRELHSLTRWNWMRRERSFSVTANAFLQTIPFEDLRDIVYIRRPASVNMRLFRVEPQVFFTERPDAGASTQAGGSPSVYVPMGRVPVTAQPASALALEVVSSDATDTTQSVTVTGMVGGHETQVTKVLNGTTAVALGAALTFTEILNVSKSAVTAGRVTLRVASAGATLVTLAGGLTSAGFQSIGMDPIPSTAESFSVGYYRRSIDLSALTDSPILPEERHNVLVYGMLADILAFEDDEAGYARFEKKWVLGVQAMMDDNETPEDKHSEIRVSPRLMRDRLARQGIWRGFDPGVDRGF